VSSGLYNQIDPPYDDRIEHFVYTVAKDLKASFKDLYFNHQATIINVAIHAFRVMTGLDDDDAFKTVCAQYDEKEEEMLVEK
jgi:hypothetical protein